jgi:VanZ family protein
VKIQIKSFWPAMFGLLVATLLFCLPGDRFSKASWLEELELDKVVHVGLFAMLVFLWCMPARARIRDVRRVNKMYIWITLSFVSYGIIIEFIQRDLIPYRSFDIFDIVADTTGCLIGWFVVRKLTA